MRIEQRNKNKDITIDVVYKEKNGRIIKIDRIKFKSTDIIEGHSFEIVKRETPDVDVIKKKLGDNITVRFTGNQHGYIMEFDIWENLFYITE